ncbi:hypothetical protein Cni_G15746 [Canna indica]|uniref:F-box domain-containing protein n=1 Tax=Canna indica TaxID=4628 RepID=A0AAQ3QBX4_9LILI|nr:hypothetical protein Cni_G15746 [Canna indica]
MSSKVSSLAVTKEGRRRWEDLPSDCLIHIFRHLGLDDLTVSLPFVCRSWWRASLDPGCWSVLNFRPLDFRPWSHFSRSLASRYRLKTSPSFASFMRLAVHRSGGAAAELFFPSSLGVSLQGLAYASIKCPRLKTLALPDNLMLEDDLRVPEFMGRWKDLEKLEMETKPSSFLETVAEIGRHCGKFSRLKVRGLIGKEDARAIANWLPELKQLELNRSYLTKEEVAVIVSGCRKLERLSVRDCLGLQADEEVRRLAAGVEWFEHEGCRLLDEHGYESDESEEKPGFFN